MPLDPPHVTLEDVAINLLNKIDVKLTKSNLVACHRLANSDRTIKKVLNRKHTEQITTNKSRLTGMNFLNISSIVEASNTSDNVDEETSVN